MTLPEVPDGHTRVYSAQMIDGEPVVLNAVHTTPSGTHIDRWTPDRGWVDYPPDLGMVIGWDDPTTLIDAHTAESYAAAGIGVKSTELSYAVDACGS